MNLRGNAIALINQRLAMKAAGHRLTRNRRVPRPLHPTGLEREYYATILWLIAPFFQDVRERLITRLPEIVQRYQEEMRTDSGTGTDSQSDTDSGANTASGVDADSGADKNGRADTDNGADTNIQAATDSRADMVMGYSQLITRIISDIRIGIALLIPDTEVQVKADAFARRTAAFNKQQVNRQFKSVLGINPLLTERWLEPQVASFVDRNVSLIKSIPEDCLKRVEQMVRSSVERGSATGTLEQEIIGQFGTAKSRAHLIARDQISKFNGKLHELRQREAGVREYIWSTSKDERVRDKHMAVDGQKFSWSDPPPVGNNGERLHPGEDYQCRCAALPVLEEFIN